MGSLVALGIGMLAQLAGGALVVGEVRRRNRCHNDGAGCEVRWGRALPGFGLVVVGSAASLAGTMGLLIAKNDGKKILAGTTRPARPLAAPTVRPVRPAPKKP